MGRFLIWCLILIVIACSPSKEAEKAVARVYDKYLYPSDLQGVVPVGVTGADSIQIIRSYIDNWVRQAVILHKAEQNVAVNNLDIQKQVNDYKNSLLIYYYEQALVNQQLDTLVTEDEARAYYEENSQNFLLSNDVYRVAYAELGANAPDLTDIKSKLLDTLPETVSELTRYSLVHASNFSYTDTSWYSFRALSEFLPMDSIGEGNPAPGRVFEIKSKNTVFLIAFRELRKKDSVSPYEMERKSIRQLILNQRKLDLLSEMEKAVFVEALENNEFEIYNNE